MGINFIIEYKVYPFELMISLGQTDAEVQKTLKRRNVDATIDYLSLRGNGRCIMFEGGQTLIRVKDVPKTVRMYAVLQHEIFHAVDFLFDRIGIKLCSESSEAYAYLVQYLTESIYKKLPKWQ